MKQSSNINFSHLTKVASHLVKGKPYALHILNSSPLDL